MDTIHDLIDSIGSLPALSSAVLDLMRRLDDEAADSGDLAQIIERDEALTATALQLANSAASGSSDKISSVRDAVTRLGRTGVLTGVLQRHLSTYLSGSDESYGLPPGEMASGSQAGALCAQMLAERSGACDPEIAYTAALLRDVGKRAMPEICGHDDLRSALAEREEDCALERERAVCGYDHTEIGEALAVRWQLPEVIQDVARYHHAPPSDRRDRILDVVHVADAVCALLGAGAGYDGLAYPVDDSALERLGLERSGLTELMADVAMELETIRTSLAGAPTPDSTMNKNVLVVDDSPLIRKVVKKSLIQIGVEEDAILEAGNGREALDSLVANEVSLVLLDINMPEMDGVEFMREYSERAEELGEVTVVVVSTESNKERIDELTRLGIRGVLRKPFQPEDIRRLAGDALDPAA